MIKQLPIGAKALSGAGSLHVR